MEVVVWVSARKEVTEGAEKSRVEAMRRYRRPLVAACRYYERRKQGLTRLFKERTTSSFSLSAIRSRSTSSASKPTVSVSPLIFSRYCSASRRRRCAPVSSSLSESLLESCSSSLAFRRGPSSSEPLPEIDSSIAACDFLFFETFGAGPGAVNFFFFTEAEVSSSLFRFFCEAGVVKKEDIGPRCEDSATRRSSEISGRSNIIIVGVRQFLARRLASSCTRRGYRLLEACVYLELAQFCSTVYFSQKPICMKACVLDLPRLTVS